MTEILIGTITEPFECWKWKCHDCGDGGQCIGKPVACAFCQASKESTWEIEKIEAGPDTH